MLVGHVSEADNNFLQMFLFQNPLRYFNNDWIHQPLEFLPSTPFALRQRATGPCGVLASINAFIVKQALWHSRRQSYVDVLPILLTFGDDVRDKVLALALQEILQQTTIGCPLYSGRTPRGPFKYALGRVNVRFGDKQFTQLQVYESETAEELLYFLTAHMREVKAAGPIGVIVSALLTRGRTTVNAEYGGSAEPFIVSVGNTFETSIDLVFFLITGRCFMVPPEIFAANDAHSAIGFMTEARIKVPFLDDPYYPVWVYHSSSHFVVYFSERLDALARSCAYLKFVEIDSISAGRQSQEYDVNPNNARRFDDENGRFGTFIRQRWTPFINPDDR